MQIATRYSIAVHILSLLGMEFESVPTSEWMADSIGTNPVVVRNITSMLRRAGLVRTSQGVAGTQLAKPLDCITLLDVYRAVGASEELFAMHNKPHPTCPVGANIQTTLESVFTAAQQAMETRLAATTMDEIVVQIKAKAGGARR